MSTRKGLNISGFTAANPMARYSDFAWSDAACNNKADSVGIGLSTGNNNNPALGTSDATKYFTAGELNLMTRFSLNSSLTLNTAGTDSDTTSSSTSSSSATINCSLSQSPANERDNNIRFNASQNNMIKPTQQASNHLLELQKEIKEEEEEIFADINSLINSRSNLYSTFASEYDEGGDDDRANLNDGTLATAFYPLTTSTLSNNNINNNNSHLPDFHSRTAVENLFTNSSDDLNDYQSPSSSDDTNNHDFQNTSAGSVIDDDHSKHKNLHQNRYLDETQSRLNYVQQNDSQYFHNGEDQQCTIIHENEAQYFDEDQEQTYDESCDQGTDYQTLQAVVQQVTNNLPKPCVFFLEGNCRRSDCKYSHDLSNITCKYWIEGFCFKGEMCPFLHSYNPPSDSSLLDDDGLQSMPKKELDPTFVIESEADFPSLPLDALTPALNDSLKKGINGDILATSIRNQILSSNPAVVFKTVKKKRKRG